MGASGGRGLRHGREAVLLYACLALGLWSAAAPGGQLTADPQRTPRGLALPDLQGREVTLEAHLGKVVMVTFWASWCTPCIQEMPAIRRLQAAMRGHPFQVIAVNVAEPPRRVQTAAARLGLDFPVLLDRDSRVFEGWGAGLLPTTYILGAEGRTRYVAQGTFDWDDAEIVARLQALATPGTEHRHPSR